MSHRTIISCVHCRPDLLEIQVQLVRRFYAGVRSCSHVVFADPLTPKIAGVVRQLRDAYGFTLIEQPFPIGREYRHLAVLHAWNTIAALRPGRAAFMEVDTIPIGEFDLETTQAREYTSGRFADTYFCMPTSFEYQPDRFGGTFTQLAPIGWRPLVASRPDSEDGIPQQIRGLGYEPKLTGCEFFGQFVHYDKCANHYLPHEGQAKDAFFQAIARRFDAQVTVKSHCRTKPYPADMVKNRALADVRLGEAWLKRKTLWVDDDEQERRRAICHANECGLFRLENASCSHASCGCPVEKKARRRTESCPLGMWAAAAAVETAPA